jgi:hypothetical protein
LPRCFWTSLWSLALDRKIGYQFEPYIGVDPSIQAALNEFELHLKQTYWLHRQVHGCKKFDNFDQPGNLTRGPHEVVRECRMNNGRSLFHILGDLEVCQSLEKSIARAAKKYHNDGWRQFYRIGSWPLCWERQERVLDCCYTS